MVGAGTLVCPFPRTQLTQFGKWWLIRTGDTAAREEVGRSCSTQRHRNTGHEPAWSEETTAPSPGSQERSKQNQHPHSYSLPLWTCVCIQSCPTLYNPMDGNPPGSSLHKTSQARVVEWVAISSPRVSSWPRDSTHVSRVSCISRQLLYHQGHLRSPSSRLKVFKKGHI